MLPLKLEEIITAIEKKEEEKTVLESKICLRKIS